jgi:hypothetical protein
MYPTLTVNKENKMKTKFIEFLDKHGVHERLERNIIEHPFTGEIFYNLKEMMDRYDSDSWINCFVWANDDDNGDLWSNLDDAWVKMHDFNFKKPVLMEPVPIKPYKLELSGEGSAKRKHCASYIPTKPEPISGMGSARRGQCFATDVKK